MIHIGGREAAFFFIDGYCKDELMEKILQYFYSITEEQMPQDVYGLLKKHMPYVEVDISKDQEVIIKNILSGVFALFIEGYESCILIDSRTYPVRSVQEPE
ncbi:MAG: spore germination protein, partial [Methanomicrobiales archaeon]|nr:spore germination protein [Methanomicrobiales archaeon]